MGKLVLHLPDGSTRDIPLSRERMTIGRRADNDVCLPLPTVSGEHAAIVTVLDDSFLEDLGSRNGTLVNGKPVRKHFLRDHDEIDVGRQRLVYVSGDFAAEAHAVAAAAPPPPPVVVRAAAASSMEVRAGRDDRVTIDTAALFAAPDAADTPGAAPRKAAEAPSVEVLDGPARGQVARVEADEFVVGRLGVQLAAIRRTTDGYRLLALEGEASPAINGAALPAEGALLALGDEIQVAGVRLRYRPPDA